MLRSVTFYRYSRQVTIQLLVICVLLIANAQSVDAEIVTLNSGELHHLKKITQNNYAITGEDPYLVFQRNNMGQHFEGIYFQIDPDLNAGCRNQPFWQTLEIGFSEQRSVRIGESDNPSAEAFYLPLNKLDQSVPITAIRIDFENCRSNIVQMADLSSRSKEDVPKNKTTFIPQKNILATLPKAIQPHIRDKGPWEIHDMTVLGERQYQIVGGDPLYLCLPD